MNTEEFIKKTNTKIEIIFIKKDKYFFDDKQKRNIYIINIIKNDKIESFNFGDSIHNTEKNIKPTETEVLECILIDYTLQFNNFEDFCLNLGYTDITKYKQIRKIYKSIKENAIKIENLYNKEELDLLKEMEF